MAAVAPQLRDLSEERLFALKRHLILDTIANTDSYPLGNETDFENTAVSIYSDGIINAFKNNNYTILPQLNERSWIVVCSSRGIYPVYHNENQEKITNFVNSFVNAELKILEISKELYKKLHKDIHVSARIIYINIDSKDYRNLSAQDKESKNYAVANIRTIKRKNDTCCTIL